MMFRSMYKGGCDVKSGKIFVLLLVVLHTPCNVILVKVLNNIRDYTLSFRWTGNARAALLRCTHFRFCNHRYGLKNIASGKKLQRLLGNTNGGRPDNGVSICEGVYSRP